MPVVRARGRLLLSEVRLPEGISSKLMLGLNELITDISRGLLMYCHSNHLMPSYAHISSLRKWVVVEDRIGI